MKNKWKAILAVFLILMMIFLTGCGSETEEVKGGENDTESTEETVDPEVEYAYRDIICDRKLTEGKMACYFFRSNYLRAKPSGVTTSGDSSLLIAPDGTTMLIDINLTPVMGKVVDYLNRMGIKKLDYVLLSHADIDHYGGYEALFNNIEIGELLISESPDWFNTANKAGRCVAKAIEMGATYKKLHTGVTLDFGGIHMETMWPVENYEWSTAEGSSAAIINGGSLVTRFSYKDASFLFAGDLYVAQENEVVKMFGDQLRSDIVKMSHHGLKTSNGEKWIEATSPKLLCGMVSTMKEEEVLARYMYHEIPFTYSIFDGTCLVYTDGNGVYDVQVEKERENSYFGDLHTEKGHFQVK